MKLLLSTTYWDIVKQKDDLVGDILTRLPLRKKQRLGNIALMVEKNIIDGVELLLPPRSKIKNLYSAKETLKSNNIPIFSVHQPLSKMMRIDFNSINYLFESAQELSAKVIVIHLRSLGKYIYNLEFINKLKSLEVQYNTKIGLENSSKNLVALPLTGIPKRYMWEEKEFAKTVNKTGLHITFDTTHLGLPKEGIVNFFLNNKEEIINIHLSDYKNNTFGTHLPLGKGLLPIKMFLQSLKNKQYNGLLTLEINGDFEKLWHSIQMVKTHCGVSDLDVM